MIHHSKPNSMNENGFKKILTSSQNDNINKVKTKTSSYLNFLSNTEKSNKKNPKLKEKEKEKENKNHLSSTIQTNYNNNKKNAINLKTLDNNWVNKVTKNNQIKKKSSTKNLVNNISVSTELIGGNMLNSSELNLNLNYSETNLTTKYTSEIIKLNNEIMEYQLKNSRLTNEINILNEKMKSLNEIITIKDTENEMYKNKYNSFMNELKNEILHLKNSNNDLKKYKSLYDKMGITFKSIIKILTDMFEFFLYHNPRTNSVRSNKSYTMSNMNTNNNNNSKYEFSIDIYDSFNNEEERKIQLISQIQGLILSKYKSIQSNFSISIEKEIDRIQNLNFNSNISVINTLSNISNIIKISKDNNDNSNSTSNDFDLSVSGTFYHHSPRFNSLENETSNISNNNNKSIKKDGLICESLFNELKNSPINTFNNSYGSFCDLDENISSKKKVKSKSNNTSITKNININITSNYNSNTNSSKNKNFINILDCSFGDIITNDNEKIVKRPSLPSVQPNELSFDNNI